MITGVVSLDLTTVKPDRQRNRLLALVEAPSGCRVVVTVGALTVEPESVRLIREHADRLDIDIQGMPRAVRRWVDALRYGLLFEATP